ncbi:MAG: UDP-3-O-acyl-N-acetylglucosamine deacetylase [Paludibacteraceae bacterium]|nr:UDP-3-O-acyl-N-acetylglucosamine deacetylase [Paludibacteraceae bacterium]
MKQHTLKSEFTLSGKGLHTGCMVSARFLPAQENTGIRMCRTDLEGKPCYEALADYVSATERGTVLKNGEWQISTVEHALSALSAMGVDNCLIEVDGAEMPILDGSALPYVEKIQKAGLKEQKADVRIFVVKEKTELEQNGSRIVLLPYDKFSLDVHISFRSPVLSNQYASIENFEEYASCVAPARTFCFVREVRPLLGMGLIKGGDLQNALVIYDEHMPQEELNKLALGLGQETHDADRLGYLSPLKFDNEPAAHKLLDLIGDLSLLGCRLQGKVIATRPGHTVNTAFCRMLRQKMMD